jgi:hypothetical protein
MGGSLSSAFTSAGYGALSGALFGGLGASQFGSELTWGSAGAYGLGGGVMSTLQGGRFGNGFVSAALGFAAGASAASAGLNDGTNLVVAAVVGGTTSAISGGDFANGALTGAFSYAFSSAIRSAARGERGVWMFPEGRSTDPNQYDTVMTNGILGDRDEFMAAITSKGAAGYFNPSHGFFADVLEAFGQKFFGGTGDSLAQGFAEGLAGVDHPINIIAHSQGTLTVTNAVQRYGLNVAGSTVELRSSAGSYYAANRIITRAGGAMRWSMPYGDAANVYSGSFNPIRWASGFGDALCGMCTHTANGLGR